MATKIAANVLTLDQQDSDVTVGFGDAKLNSSVARDTSVFYTEPASVRGTAIAAGDFTIGTGYPNVDGLVPDSTYEFRTHWRPGTAGRSIGVIVNFVTTAGNYHSQFINGLTTVDTGQASSTATVNAWREMKSPATVVPAGCTKAEVVLLVAGASANEQHWFDRRYLGVVGGSATTPTTPVVVNAGVDQTVVANSVVTLSGTPAGGVWSQDSGDAVTLSAPNTTADSTSVSFVSTNSSTTTNSVRVFRYTVEGV